MNFLLAMFLAAALLLPSPAVAEDARACGTANGAVREPTSTDALFVLQGAVGIAGSCGPCLCDVDSSGTVSAVDALATLRRAVGIGAVLHCPACACTALTRLQTGARPSSVVAVDLDEDGFTDLVTADLESDEVSVFYGRGRGVFEDRVGFDVGDTPQSVTVADLDDDGFLDIIASDAIPNSLTVLFGAANRTFASAAGVLPAGAAPINSVAIDIDGDDALDLVVANSLSDDISVFLGNGDGSFAPEVRYSVGTGPRWVALADMDGDEILDALTANRDSNDISILSGNGDGTFDEERRIGTVASPYHVSLADLDGDDRIDIVAAANAGDAIAVFLAKGDHNFEEPVLYPSSSHPIQTSIGDFNGDDVPDIAAANYSGAIRGASIFLGVGDGTFAATRFEQTGVKPRSVTAADIDGNGTDDIVTANASSSTLTLLHGNGDGTFIGARESTATHETSDLIAADFDHDGFDDVATADLVRTITVYEADGTGHFGRTVYPLDDTPVSLFAGQITGTSEMDLVATAYASQGDQTSQRSLVLEGHGDATFTLTDKSTELVIGEPIRGSTAAADLNDDNRLDLVIGVGEIEILLARPDGTFQSYDEVDALQTFPALALADLDKDGDKDLVELVRNEGVVRVRLNDGNLNFGPPQSYDVSSSYFLAVADIDSDGDADIVTASGNSDGTVSVLRGNGHGEFSNAVTSQTGVQLSRLEVVDLDGDHAADIASTIGNRVYVLPGDARGHFGESRSASLVMFSPGVNSSFVESGNFDSSPGRDLVVASHVEGKGNQLIELGDVGECMVR